MWKTKTKMLMQLVLYTNHQIVEMVSFREFTSHFRGKVWFCRAVKKLRLPQTNVKRKRNQSSVWCLELKSLTSQDMNTGNNNNTVARARTAPPPIECSTRREESSTPSCFQSPTFTFRSTAGRLIINKSTPFT